MYPSHSRSAIITEQAYLWPDFVPYGKHRKRAKPAYVLSREARIAVMSLRQYFRQDLEHPDDLWQDPNRVNAGEIVANLRNGAAVATGDFDGDVETIAKIQAEEEKMLAAYDAMETLQELQRKAKYLEQVLRARDKATSGQIRNAVVTVKRALSSVEEA